MRIFFDGQGRTRVLGPRKAGQEGLQSYAAAGNPRRTTSIGKKTIYVWKLFGYHPCEPHRQRRIKGNDQQIDEQQC
jgi:hypothetical protein